MIAAEGRDPLPINVRGGLALTLRIFELVDSLKKLVPIDLVDNGGADLVRALVSSAVRGVENLLLLGFLSFFDRALYQTDFVSQTKHLLSFLLGAQFQCILNQLGIFIIIFLCRLLLRSFPLSAAVSECINDSFGQALLLFLVFLMFLSLLHRKFQLAFKGFHVSQSVLLPVDILEVESVLLIRV